MKNSVNILYVNTSYDFARGVNANRVYDLLNYFSKKKYKVTHLTPISAFRIPGIRNLVVPYSCNNKPNKYFSFIKSLYSWKDSKQHETWVKDIIKYVEKNPGEFKGFDLVFINTQPRCLVKLGSFFKGKFGCKVIVDFHDPFAYDPYRPNLSIFDSWLKNYEKALLKDVDMLLVITPSMLPIYQKHYPRLKLLYLPHVLTKILPSQKYRHKKKEKYTIVYGGSLHGRREIFPLLEALKSVEKVTYEVVVIGDTSKFTRLRYWRYPRINWCTLLKREEYLKYFNQNADIGITAQSFAVRDTGISGIAAKTYEYLALNKPIIYIGPPGDNVKILEKYSNNYFAFTGSKNDKQRLTGYLSNFKSLSINTKPSFYKNYQADRIYEPLNIFLKEILSSTNPHN